jgi:chemotaxis protein methyltransferase CheR
MLGKQEAVVNVSDHELAEVRHMIEQRSGILFDDSRERFFRPRVREHLEAMRLANGSELLRVLRSSNVEYDKFLERLLTQETSFNRYPAMFQALEKKVLPEMRMKKFWENPRTLRVWSAGCSTGEEPYTIAITISDAFDFAEAWNIHILATDISRQALDVCEKGVYPARELAGLTPKQRDAYFTKQGDEYKVKAKIKQMVQFAPLNLAQAVYMGRFDIIFCMNVMIYFTDERRAALIQRFFEYLEPGGYLFVGHAESIAKAGVNFEPIVVGDSLIYQKPNTGVPRRLAAAGERL